LIFEAGTDKSGFFGLPGDVPVIGDWDGTGIFRAGIYRASVGLWGLDMNANLAWDPGIDRYGAFGLSTDAPIVGRWK